MIFRLGLTMMGVALALTLGVALSLVFSRGEMEPVVRAEETQPVEEPTLQRRERDRPPREEATREEPRPAEPAREDPGVLPVADSDWPGPSETETAVADGPRYFAPRQDSVLTLTVDSLGLYDVPVLDSGSEAALEESVIHIPQTPMPWEDREQKNVYLAGHRLGYPNTGSRLIFYNLDKLQGGDVISLRDKSGNVYKYRVTEMFEVDPSDDWVMDTVLDRDIVTLQTCTPVPTFEKRLVVRADRIKKNVSFG